MDENTEVIPLTADALEVRYYDDGKPGTYRCWKIPLHEARDLARWWAETGSGASADRPPSGSWRVGSVVVSFLSATQVYALGCDKLTQSYVTGYQLPRAAVAVLGAWLDQHPGPLTQAGAPAAVENAPCPAREAAR